MELDILGGSFQHRFQDVNPQRSINWYVVNGTDNEDNKTRHSLFPTPGLTTLCDIPGSKVRGLFLASDLTSNRCFAVVDDTLYEIYKDSTYTSRGNLIGGVGSTGPVYFTVNTNNQLMIVDGGSCADYLDSFSVVTNNSNLIGNILNLTTNTLTAITDADFPDTAADQGRVYFSAANDSSSWDPSDVFTPTFRADPVLRIIAFREEIYCFGSRTIEIYLNDGTTPFSRRQGSTLSCGIVAPASAAIHPNGIIFLGKSERGQPQVYQLTFDYQIQTVAPNSISWAIGQNPHLEDCSGYIQENAEGHLFYYLDVPSKETTLVYDLQNFNWHERRSTKPFYNADGSQDQGMFRGNCYVNWDGYQLFGDRYSGKIFKEDYSSFTEDSQPIVRERYSIIYTQEYKPISADTLEIDINSGVGATSGQGSDPLLMFRISKDKGMTYSNERMVPLGPLGKYNTRVRFHSMGTAEHFAFHLKLTDPISCAIIGATLKLSYGAV